MRPDRQSRPSRTLTKGHRWKIFGILLLVSLVNGVLNYALSKLTIGLLGYGLALAVTYAWAVVVGAFSTLLNAMVYFGLSTAKDGPGEQRLAAVFD